MRYRSVAESFFRRTLDVLFFDAQPVNPPSPDSTIVGSCLWFVADPLAAAETVRPLRRSETSEPAPLSIMNLEPESGSSTIHRDNFQQTSRKEIRTHREQWNWQRRAPSPNPRASSNDDRALQGRSKSTRVVVLHRGPRREHELKYVRARDRSKRPNNRTRRRPASTVRPPRCCSSHARNVTRLSDAEKYGYSVKRVHNTSPP